MELWVYQALRHTHLTLVGLSVSLFVTRGLGVLARQAWPMRTVWRRASVWLDSGLLLAGAALWWYARHNPLREPWLAVKLGLLIVYIVLGSFALKRGKTPAVRAACLVAALLCVASMAWIAHTRSPWGGVF